MSEEIKFSVNDVERIVESKQARLDALSIPEIWRRMTNGMECGEYKEFKQGCVDDEIIIAILKRFLTGSI